MPFHQSLLRNLIINHSQFILSHRNYKRIILTGQLCVISCLICLGYLILDLVSKVPHAWPYQLACATLSLISFILNRNGKFTAARLMLGLSVNLTVFIFSINEPIGVGLYMYFIVCNLGALIVFGFEEIEKAIFFVILSTVLFIVSLFIHADFISRPMYSPEYVQINMIINFIGASSSSFLLAYFLINVNYRAEARMIKREKVLADSNSALTRVNTELDRFVYSSSHDLRAPLHSIQGLIQLTDYTNDPEELRKYIEMMRGRVTSLEKFILDIANYARNSKQSVVVEVVSIKRLVIDAFESVRFFPGADKIKVHQQIPGDLIITTDVTRLQIILNNLISNAVKYQDPLKGDKFIKITAEVKDEVLALAIEDNGIGIPKNSYDKIFQMYSRLHDQSFGSGLGLYMVKETIEKIGGSIYLKSEEGVGTTFTIKIPSLKKEDENSNQALVS